MIRAWALALLLAAQAGGAAAANYENDEPGVRKRVFAAGDLLEIGIPAAGFALTFLLDNPAQARPAKLWGADVALDLLRFDGAPRHDFFAAGLRMVLVTESLKATVNEQRPDGGAHAFPSGHAAAAFMGAEFIRKEYGWGWGAPAYLAAGFVGWTRVVSQNHWTHDVLAGAAIGIGSNHDFAGFSMPFGEGTVAPALLEAPLPGGPAPGLRFTTRF